MSGLRNKSAKRLRSRDMLCKHPLSALFISAELEECSYLGKFQCFSEWYLEIRITSLE
jgi:hypothetical protein